MESVMNGVLIGAIMGFSLMIFVGTVARYSVGDPHRAATIQAVAAAVTAVLVAAEFLHRIAFQG